MSAIIEYGAGDRSISRTSRTQEPPLPEPVRLPARREPLLWFGNPERVAETAKLSWGGPYDWAGA